MERPGFQTPLATSRATKAGVVGSVTLHLLGLAAILLAHPFTPPPAAPFAVAVSLIMEPAPAEPSATPPPKPQQTPVPAPPPSVPTPAAKAPAPPHPAHKIATVASPQPSASSTAELSETAQPETPQVAPPAAPGGGGMTASYLSAVEQTVRVHLIYPAQALRRREQGVILVRMLVAADGSILSAEGEDEQASPLLLAAALQAVRDASPFPPLPPGLPEKPARLVVPVTFALKG